MATCSSFQEIFEKPLPENPTLIESLASSWKKIKAKQQLHFKENLDSASSSCSDHLPSTPMDVTALPENEKVIAQGNNKYIFENIFGNKKESSLSSLFDMPKTHSDEVENSKSQSVDDWQVHGNEVVSVETDSSIHSVRD
ncbi:hypothetical protein MKW92_013770, partial [Papaver armeniacum]